MKLGQKIQHRHIFYRQGGGASLLLQEDGGKLQLEDSSGFIALETLLAWILALGIWDDAGYWLDHKLWID